MKSFYVWVLTKLDICIQNITNFYLSLPRLLFCTQRIQLFQNIQLIWGYLYNYTPWTYIVLVHSYMSVLTYKL